MSSPRPRKIIVLTDNSVHLDAVQRLRARAEVRILSAYPDEATMIEACRDADAILARLGVVSSRVINASPNLRIVARHGAGSDGVDLAAATARGVLVTTTGPANAAAVAEYSIALLLGLLRKLPDADAGMRNGLWSREGLVGGALEGGTLGIVGCGAVGRRVARIARAFGMFVLASASNRPNTVPPPVPTLPLSDLLPRCDVISLHLRLTPDNAGIIDARSIASMKRGAVLVNTARGELVDEAALIDALRSGHLAGAALDTFAVEPLSASSALRSMTNVVLSPHVAGQTSAAVLRVGHAAAQAILDDFDGKRPAFVVNPEAYQARSVRSVREDHPG